jgi:hypothetical protein
MRGSQAGRGEAEARMTNHLARLYAAAGTIIAFFLLWMTIAAHPWAAAEPVTPQDPRLVALAQREKRLQKRAADVKRIVDRRWAIYERRVAKRELQNSIALQQHMKQLEASQAAAVRAARAASAQSAEARTYAASVVAWANQQLQGAPASAATPARALPAAVTAATPKSASSAPPAAATSKTKAPATTVAAPAPAAPSIAAPAAPAASSAPAPPAAPTPAPAPAPAPAAAAPPPVQVVTLPPVTKTKVSKK